MDNNDGFISDSTVMIGMILIFTAMFLLLATGVIE